MIAPEQVKDVQIRLNSMEEDIQGVETRTGGFEEMREQITGVQGQVYNNKEKIEEIQLKDLLNIKEELETIRTCLERL